MSLVDRLDRALAEKQLRPIVTVAPVQEVKETCCPKGEQGVQSSTGMYSTLEAALEVADSIQPDEMGTRIMVVEAIDFQQTLFQLPMITQESSGKMGRYVVDDIQKRAGGGYEVHLVERNQR